MRYSAMKRELDNPVVDKEHNRYPYCVVWGSLPCLTWLFPFIGHLGICDSEGRVHDFAGPYYIGIDSFMTGPVYRYLKIEEIPLQEVQSGEVEYSVAWDSAVERADAVYRKRMHNLCCDNCHHHTALALQYMGYTDMTMIRIWWKVMTRGTWTSPGKLVQTLAPTMVILAIILIVLFH